MAYQKVKKTDRTDSWVGGVLGGIAKHYNFNPFFLRLTYLVLLCATSGIFTLLYAGLYFLMPEESEE